MASVAPEMVSLFLALDHIKQAKIPRKTKNKLVACSHKKQTPTSYNELSQNTGLQFPYAIQPARRQDLDTCTYSSTIRFPLYYILNRLGFILLLSTISGSLSSWPGSRFSCLDLFKRRSLLR